MKRSFILTCCILLTLILSVSGIEENCFRSSSCSDSIPIANFSYLSCCEVGSSYVIASGVCCDCNQDAKVEFSSSMYTISEGSGIVTLNLLRCGLLNFDEDVEVILTFSDRTAKGGIDYGPFPSSTIHLIAILPANSSETAFGMIIHEDEVVENPETFSVSMRLLSDGGFNPFGGGSVSTPQPGATSETVVVIQDNDFVRITFEPNSFEILESEENRELTFSVRKNGTAVRNVSILFMSVTNSSASNRDFVETKQDLVFLPDVNELSATFEVLDDEIVESTEEVLLVLMEGIGERGVRFPQGTIINGTILDDNDKVHISFSQTSHIAEERSGVAMIELMKSGENERDVSVVVKINAENSTATEGVDFNLTSNRVLTFGPNDVTLNFSIFLYQENIYEKPEEVVSLFLEPDLGETGVDVGGASELTISDNDVVEIGFIESEYTASESTGSLDVTIQLLEGILDTQVEVQISVLSVASNLAEEGKDFMLPRTSFIFEPRNPPNISFVVDLVDDPFFEGREDFTLQLRTNNPRVIFSQGTTDISIVDNEDLNIQFENVTYSVDESDSRVNVTITLFADIERDISLTVNTSDGRAVAGGDYSPISQIVSFTPTLNQTQVSVRLLDDMDSEGLEEFFLIIVLVDEQLGIPGIINRATVLIFDDENIFIKFSSSEFTANEGDGFIPLIITKSGETQEDIDVIVSLRDASAKGGIDYGFFPTSHLNITTTIHSSETQILLGVVLHDDDIVERRESFTATLYLPGGPMLGSNVFITDIAMATVFVMDNDVINVTILPESVQSEESNDVIFFEISRTDEVEIDTNLELSVEVFTNPGSAEESQDFVGNRMVLTFSKGSAMNFTFNVELLEDLIVEETENFTVTLLANEDHVFLYRDEVEILLSDNDAVTVNMESELYEVVESDAFAAVCLIKDAVTARPLWIIVQPMETSPTLQDTFQARADVDFDSAPVNAFFSGHQNRTCVNVRIINDFSAGESREEFAVGLSNPEISMEVIIGQPSRAAVVINDIPDVNVGFVRTTIEVSETIGSVDVCLQILNPTSEEDLDTSLHVTLVTESVTATSLSDYTTTNNAVLYFNDTMRRACLEITIINDDEFEDLNELLVVRVLNLSLSNENLVPFASIDSTQIIIVDDDREVALGFNDNSTTVSVNESVGEVFLCVQIFSPGPDKQFTSLIRVAVGTRPDSADPRDYTAISTIQQEVVLNLTSSDRITCFPVGIIDDRTFEGFEPEKFEIVLTVQAGTGDDLQRIVAISSLATVNIVDNDQQVFLAFERVSYQVEESFGVVTLCVALNMMSLDEELGQQFVARVSIDNDETTAEFQLDFDFDRNLLLFFNSTQRRQCFDVSIIDDEVYETDVAENLTLLLQLAAGNPLSVGIETDHSVAVISILDNDPFPTTTTTTMRPTATPILTILGNDTVVGDPLFSVPFYLAPEERNILPNNSQKEIPHLCFEVIGRPDTYFNFITDQCTSVNALYSSIPSDFPAGFNVITKIGISAVDTATECVFIDIGTNNSCNPIIYNANLNSAEAPYNRNGISVVRRKTHVRISVPNCGNSRLVMYVTCENGSVPMLRFDVTRGVNLSPTSHGILGQFWNVPTKISPYVYNGMPSYLDEENLYSITVSHPDSTPRRFVAEHFTRKWDTSRGTCFYAGNIQGGSLLEITDPSFNDPVIEGEFTDYTVQGLFQNSYQYSRFNTCDLP